MLSVQQTAAIGQLIALVLGCRPGPEFGRCIFTLHPLIKNSAKAHQLHYPTLNLPQCPSLVFVISDSLLYTITPTFWALETVRADLNCQWVKARYIMDKFTGSSSQGHSKRQATIFGQFRVPNLPLAWFWTVGGT